MKKLLFVVLLISACPSNIHPRIVRGRIRHSHRRKQRRLVAKTELNQDLCPPPHLKAALDLFFAQDGRGLILAQISKYRKIHKSILRNLGFEIVASKAKSVVVRHPDLPGYVIKKHHRNIRTRGRKKSRLYDVSISKRVTHARLIQEAITFLRLNFIHVPEKYAYQLPLERPLHFFEEDVVVIAKDIWTDRAITDITPEEIDQAFKLFKTGKVNDITKHNLILAEDGLYIIDTEQPPSSFNSQKHLERFRRIIAE